MRFLINVFFFLSLCIPLAAHPIQIFVKYGSDKVNLVEIDPQQSIAALKIRIMKKMGLTEDFLLKTGTGCLRENGTLSDAGIYDNDTIFVYFPLKSCKSCKDCIVEEDTVFP